MAAGWENNASHYISWLWWGGVWLFKNQRLGSASGGESDLWHACQRSQRLPELALPVFRKELCHGRTWILQQDDTKIRGHSSPFELHRLAWSLRWNHWVSSSIQEDIAKKRESTVMNGFFCHFVSCLKPCRERGEHFWSRKKRKHSNSGRITVECPIDTHNLNRFLLLPWTLGPRHGGSSSVELTGWSWRRKACDPLKFQALAK